MKVIQKLGIFSIIFILFLSFSQCKSQDVKEKVPFTIIEKTYFYWVGGKKGTNGLNIKIVGNFNTTNLDFTTIYFQNREYKVVPQFSADKFTLIGSYSVLNTKEILAEQDIENKTSEGNEKILSELENDEAIIVYAINGKNYYYKINGVKKLETVYYQ